MDTMLRASNPSALCRGRLSGELESRQPEKASEPSSAVQAMGKIQPGGWKNGFRRLAYQAKILGWFGDGLLEKLIASGTANEPSANSHRGFECGPTVAVRPSVLFSMVTPGLLRALPPPVILPWVPSSVISLTADEPAWCLVKANCAFENQ